MSDEKRPGLHIVANDGAPVAKPNAEPQASDVTGANDEAKKIKLTQLEAEHRDLDNAIASLEERMPYDRLTIQRLKKRKLGLKDDILRLQAEVLPDIIA